MNPRVSDAALMSELAGGDGAGFEDALVAMAGKRHSASDQQIVQTMHDHAVALGAGCATEAKMSGTDTRHKVSLADAVLALLGKDSTPPRRPHRPRGQRRS
jgi:hypothetical protein